MDVFGGYHISIDSRYLAQIEGSQEGAKNHDVVPLYFFTVIFLVCESD